MHKLELELNTDKHGTTAYKIIEVLNSLGFSAKGIKLNFNMIDSITFPCIAHVVVNNTYNHYIVIYKVDIKSKKILIADPESSIKRISLDDFLNIL